MAINNYIRLSVIIMDDAFNCTVNPHESDIAMALGSTKTITKIKCAFYLPHCNSSEVNGTKGKFP